MSTASGPSDSPLNISPVTKTCGTKPSLRISLTAAIPLDFPQAHIDDHQIGMTAPGGCHSGGRVDFHGADDMAELFEHLRQKRANHKIVLDDQDT